MPRNILFKLIELVCIKTVKKLSCKNNNQIFKWSGDIISGTITK